MDSTDEDMDSLYLRLRLRPRIEDQHNLSSRLPCMVDERLLSLKNIVLEADL